MTARDKIIVGAIAAFVALAAYWFLLLAPERKKADDLGKQVATQRQTLQQAQADATASQAARASYAADYATVARLGKAVPIDDDVPSLVYQLQSASSNTGVDFRSIKLVGSVAGAPPAPTTRPSGGSRSQQNGQQQSKGQQQAKGSSGNSSSSAPKTNGPSPSGGANNGGQAGASPTSPASQAAAAGLPPGASVGTAGLVTMPFSFTFEGDFFHLSDFFRKLERFIRSGPNNLTVNGRLLTVDGIALAGSDSGFRHVTANVSATAYLLPDTQGLMGGATPTGPTQPGSGGTGTAQTGGTGGAPAPAPTTAAAAAP